MTQRAKAAKSASAKPRRTEPKAASAAAKTRTRPGPVISPIPTGTPAERAKAVLAWMKGRGSPKIVSEMSSRYGITAPKAFGLPMADLRGLGKAFKRDHALAAALWKTGWYEARAACAFIDDPSAVTPEQMDRWCEAFDNWAVCDGICFHLFDKTPHAYAKVEEWAPRPEEFVRRAAFALAASLALHDKKAPDAPFLKMLPLIEAAAGDGRNFVKKGVSWALRGIGKRNPALRGAARALAARLAASKDAPARWIGKDALRDLDRPGR